MGKILLTSTGFDQEVPRKAFENLLREMFPSDPKIIVIPSGMKGYPRASLDLLDYLASWSRQVSLLDLHSQAIEPLKNCDVCIIAGGSPYVLLSLLRPKGAAILSKLLRQHKLLVGMSGGAMVLGKDVGITELINPTIPKPKDFDMKALGFFEQNVFPHFDRYRAGAYSDRQEAVDRWLQENSHFAIRDEEFVIVDYRPEPAPR